MGLKVTDEMMYADPPPQSLTGVGRIPKLVLEENGGTRPPVLRDYASNFL